MFTRTSKYDEAVAVAAHYKREYQALLKEHNNLVVSINKKGGQDFLNRATISSTFDAEDIRRLKQLCHPDKHAGSALSTTMFQKLNTL